MERGSLLEEALSQHAAHDDLQNTLLLDVFVLPSRKTTQEQLLTQLAATAQRWNERILQSDAYPWLAGNPLQFGLHSTPTSSSGPIFHLRAQCVYGASVADEWKAILLVLHELTTMSNDNDMVVECWDVDDGQVLLIQAAQILPSWVDAIGPEACRHRCWIQKGEIRLLEPKDVDSARNLTLAQALQQLGDEATMNINTSATRKMRSVIESSAAAHIATNAWHKTVALIPQSTAQLLDGNNGLVHRCIHQLHVTAKTEKMKTKSPPTATATCDIDADPLIWLPLRMGRTAYAMLLSSAAHLPPQPRRKEQSRLPNHLADARTCGNVLHYALQQLLLQQGEQRAATNDAIRTGNWRIFVDQSLGLPGYAVDKELAAACPIFEAELQRAPSLPLSKDDDGSSARTFASCLSDPPPGPELVDSTDWMELPTTSSSNRNNNELDDMLTGVQSFLQGQSAATEGVEYRRLDSSHVLQLLHTALHSTVDELRGHLERANDPFFTQSDYDLMDPQDDGHDTSDGSEDDDDDKFGIADVMQAMDEELRDTKPMASTELEGSVDVLSNLMRSLEAGGGGPGPVQSLLSQAGQTAPKVIPEEDNEEIGS